MLRKLLKYDFLYGIKTFFICIGAILIYGLAGKYLPDTFLQKIPLVVQLLIIAFPLMIPVICVVLVIRSYSTGIFGSQGYLTMTVPAGTGTILLSKLIVAFVWFNVILVSAVAVFYFVTMGEIPVKNLFTGDTLLLAFFTVLSIDLVALNVMQGVYTAISLGHIVKRVPRWIACVLGAGLVALVEYLAGKLIWLNPYGPIIRNSDGVLMIMRRGDETQLVYTQYADLNLFILTAGFTVLLFFVNRWLVKDKVNVD